MIKFPKELAQPLSIVIARAASGIFREAREIEKEFYIDGWIYLHGESWFILKKDLEFIHLKRKWSIKVRYDIKYNDGDYILSL